VIADARMSAKADILARRAIRPMTGALYVVSRWAAVRDRQWTIDPPEGRPWGGGRHPLRCRRSRDRRRHGEKVPHFASDDSNVIGVHHLFMAAQPRLQFTWPGTPPVSGRSGPRQGRESRHAGGVESRHGRSGSAERSPHPRSSGGGRSRSTSWRRTRRSRCRPASPPSSAWR
jgi:hypothetical protein